MIYSGPLNFNITQGTNFAFNLDGDAFNDITLSNFVYTNGNYMGAFVNYFPGRLVGFTASYSYVSNLAPGASIDLASTTAPGTNFVGSMAYGAQNPAAQFNNVTGAFFGFSFPSGANTFFAWMRVDINQALGTFRVVDFAYESTPNTGILAGAGVAAVPEPATFALGLLAAGATGVGIYRRQRAKKAA